jgi:hypothetical protein
MRKSKAHKALEELLDKATIEFNDAASDVEDARGQHDRAVDAASLANRHLTNIQETLAGVEADLAATKPTPPEDSD